MAGFAPNIGTVIGARVLVSEERKQRLDYS